MTDLPDLIGTAIDLDGQSCQIVGVWPVASAGRATLYIISMAVETRGGGHVHGAIPLVATPTPGNAPPRIVRPASVFDDAGKFIEFRRPHAEHIDGVRWVGMDGTPYHVNNGWPTPSPVLSQVEQIRRKLTETPGLDELDLRVGGRLVRRCGVHLVDNQGQDRDPGAIRADALERLEVLKRGYAPGACIAALEEMIGAVAERS